MKRIMIPTAALIAATLAAPAFASSFKADRGYDDAQSYQVVVEQTGAAKGQTTSTSGDAFKDFDQKFGVPHPNFESGRR